MNSLRQGLVLASLFIALASARAFGSGDDLPDLPSDVFALDLAEGVVTEARCFMNTGASGERHKYCAYLSLKADLPVGIVERDGSFVYLIVEPKKIAKYVDKTIRVRGRFLRRT